MKGSTMSAKAAACPIWAKAVVCLLKHELFVPEKDPKRVSLIPQGIPPSTVPQLPTPPLEEEVDENTPMATVE